MKILVLIFFFMAWSSVLTAQQIPSSTIKGKASFYSDWFDGRLTASGERFSQEEYTAAHMTLPFGTWVEVTNRKNGKSVYLRINDRGPYVKGRIIDLSKAAAKAIGDLNQGIFHVEIRVVQKREVLIQPLELLKNEKELPLRQSSPYLDYKLEW